MKIGDIFVVVKEFNFNGRHYKIGDHFKIIGDSGFRGWDLEDMDGNKIYETRMIHDHFSDIAEERDKKLKKLGI